MDNQSVISVYEKMVANPLAPMTLRIGVAGHRQLPASELPRLRTEIGAVYQAIGKAVLNLAQDKVAKCIYSDDSDETPTIRIISSLAEGADRLCIDSELAVFAGIKRELASILPFLKEVFEQDFLPENSVIDHQNGTVAEFNEILSRIGYGRPHAQVIELDGDTDNRDAAYNNCSRLLVEHSDILIAVYDGDDAENKGTAAAVIAAKQNGIPVIHISTKPDTPIRCHCSTRFGRSPCTADYTEDVLTTELCRVLLFTEVLDQDEPDEKAKASHQQKILDRFKQYRLEDNLHVTTDEPDFDNTGPIRCLKKYPDKKAQSFDWLKRIVATPKAIQKEASRFKERSLATAKTAETAATNGNAEPAIPDNIKPHFAQPGLNRYFAAYLRADRLANYYANIHRSTFVLIYLFGALALIAAVSALVVPKSWGEWGVIIFVLAELGLLAAILRYYWKDHRQQFHDRWLEYRCLAEFMRPMRYLIVLGRPYAISNFRDTEEYLSREVIGHSAVGRSWLYIYTETINRWAGFNACRLDPVCKHRVSDFIKASWLNGQIQYHAYNAAAMRVLGRNLGRLSFAIFFATAFFVVGKLILLSLGVFNDDEIAHGFTASVFAWLAAVLPMLATTAYAIRNHAEFDISAQRSLTMRAALICQRKRLNPDQTSRQMAATLNQIATVTIKETTDWLEIYEVKESELG